MASFVMLLSITSVEAACLTAQQARHAVQNNQAVPLSALAINGQIISAQLCQQGGRLVYVLKVLNEGNVNRLVVDAKPIKNRGG